MMIEPFEPEIDPQTVATSRGDIVVAAKVETSAAGKVYPTIAISELEVEILGVPHSLTFPVSMRSRRGYADRACLEMIAFKRIQAPGEGYLQFSGEVAINDAKDSLAVITYLSGDEASPEVHASVERAYSDETKQLLAANPGLVERLESAVSEVWYAALNESYRHEARLDDLCDQNAEADELVMGFAV